jgi:hypothetical protein
VRRRRPRLWASARAAGLVVVSVAMLTGVYTTGLRKPAGDPGALTVAVQLAAVAVTLAVLLRFGLLAYLAVLVSPVLLTNAPLMTYLAAWYAPSGLAVAGLAAYGCVVSLGGRPLLG